MKPQLLSDRSQSILHFIPQWISLGYLPLEGGDLDNDSANIATAFVVAVCDLSRQRFDLLVDLLH